MTGLSRGSAFGSGVPLCALPYPRVGHIYAGERAAEVESGNPPALASRVRCPTLVASPAHSR
jgi:hypothetical protein